MGSSGTAQAGVRDRICDSTIGVVGHCGYQAATTAAIAEQAGVSINAVSALFSDKDGCCRAAFEAVCQRLDCLLLPVYLRPEPWRSRIRQAVFVAVRYCSQHEDDVHFAIEHCLRRGEAGLGEPSLRLHLEQLESARLEQTDRRPIPLTAAETAMGSCLGLVVGQHLEGSFAETEARAPDLLFGIFRAYLGLGPAEEELCLLAVLRRDEDRLLFVDEMF